MIVVADCREFMAGLYQNSVDSIVCDPPYELGFMGKRWDGSGISYDPEVWRLALRVLKPGGHLVAFGGTRTYHRLGCAVDDAGFEIRDSLLWLYGSGFPKSHDVSKAMDKSACAEREVVGPGKYLARKPRGTWGGTAYGSEPSHGNGPVDTAQATDLAKRWDGWGTALKPAHEPAVLARKPLIGTVAANVERYGTGGLNIDACRVATSENLNGGAYAKTDSGTRGASFTTNRAIGEYQQPTGRWPANVCHDGSDSVMSSLPTTTSNSRAAGEYANDRVVYNTADPRHQAAIKGSSGSVARFFYCAKANKGEREAGLDSLPSTKGRKNIHPTVKPLSLMRWLVRLVTPPGGLVLDPFCGSGSTGCAALMEGMSFIGCDLDQHYVDIANARVKHWMTATK